MTQMNKGKLLFCSLISGVGCLSATYDDLECEITVGKEALGYDIPVTICYHNNYYPVGEVSYKLYPTRAKEEILFQSQTYNYNINNLDGVWNFETKISKDYYPLNESLFIEILFNVREDTWWFPKSTSFTFTHLIANLEGSVRIVNPEANSVRHVSRGYANLANGNLTIAHDSYYFGNWEADVSGSLYHGINISSALIGYCDARGEKALTGSATLYVYDNPTEWNIGSLSMDKGKLFRVIPLNFARISTKTIDGKKYRVYAPSLTEEYIVDRYNLKMYPKSSGLAGTQYFSTTDLFIPFRNHKESTTWNFSIHYFNLGDYSDEVRMDFSIKVDSHLFGNCDDAEYCVGLGK